jgi:hypothetical protein
VKDIEYGFCKILTRTARRNQSPGENKQARQSGQKKPFNAKSASFSPVHRAWVG